MSIEVKVPAFPESVTDGTIVTWHKRPGEAVKRDETLVDIETDKVVFEVPAADNGVLQEVLEEEGATVVSGQVIGRLDTSASAKATAKPATAASAKSESQPEKISTSSAPSSVQASKDAPAAPSARKLMDEHGLDGSLIPGSGKDGRILKEDVLSYLQDASEPKAGSKPSPTPVPRAPENKTAGINIGERTEKRVPMSRLRARIAERLVNAQHTAAILTTFNEVNMQPVMDLRKRYREQFEKEHGVRLGFLSFFVKASVEALKRYPEVNASVDGTDIVYHGFFDLGIAVSTPRGLVVPILRDVDQLSMADIEKKVSDFGQKAQKGALAIDDITGGTFSITNGGVFGSLMSTPILNPPQSAILGMHKIQERPMAENGQVVIRPMMYLALSYDHRLVDGREAVQFLVTIKELLEDPARILLAI